MKIGHILLSLGIISVTGLAFAEKSVLPSSPKIDPYVQNQFKLRSHLSNQVLVVLKDQADLSGADLLSSRESKIRFVYDALRKKALATQGPLIAFLQAKKVNFQRFYIENMIAVDNPSPELVKALAERDDVARIMGNPYVPLKIPGQSNHRLLKTSSGTPAPEQNLVHMGATKVWDLYKVYGEGIVVAGQDTGVEWEHPALINQYRGSKKGASPDHHYNWHDAIHRSFGFSHKGSCGYDSAAPCDDQGHGTHTMGTIVGDDQKANQIGVAPKAQWIACKNMNRGVGTPATYLECFEFFLAPYPLNGNPLEDGDPSKAPHIINNSWGCPLSEGCKGDEILPALKAMKKAGILVVASAGNEGSSCGSIESPPAWHSGYTFSVGAVDHRSGNIAYFSSRGPSRFDNGPGPHITAPGVSIRSSVPGKRYESGMWSGTSMSGPHVAGAAALLWSSNNALIGDISKTVSLLQKSATPKTTTQNCGDVPGTSIPNNTYGYGHLNVAQAICMDKGSCSKS